MKRGAIWKACVSQVGKQKTPGPRVNKTINKYKSLSFGFVLTPEIRPILYLVFDLITKKKISYNLP
jgi:hypothetical protein